MLVLDRSLVLEHILQVTFDIMVVLLTARLPAQEHIRTQGMYQHRRTLPDHLLVLELTLGHSLALELILVHMQTHLPVQEHIRVGIQVAELILARILAHMQVIQFKQLKIQYQQYLSGFAPLKLYYILYIISFYGELNDCG